MTEEKKEWAWFIGIGIGFGLSLMYLDGWFCKPTGIGMYIAFAFAGVMLYLWVKLKMV